MFVTDVTRLAYDCVIVGSGPAGMSLALELGRLGKRVLVLESGEQEESRPELANSIGYGHFSGGYWNAHWIRALGGTSNAWSGWCTTLRSIDFNNPAVGTSWPISRSDLLPYYRKAAPILDRDSSIVDVEKPLFSGFLYRPFSTNAPTRFGSKYGDTLKTSATVDVAAGCSAIGFDANDARTFVRTVHYFHHASGSKRRLAVNASQSVVAAAGGLGNAQLLLQPRDDGAVPVGNEGGQVGKCIMEHPHFRNAAEFILDADLDSFSPPSEFGEVRHGIVTDDALSIERGLFACSLECREKTTDEDLARYFSRRNGRTFYHYTVDLRSEMLPSAGNRVFLTGERDRTGLCRPGVRCVLGAGDFMNAEMTLRIFGEALIKTQKGRVRIDNDRIYERFTGGGHTMGTTGMGDNRSTSVVDRDCRVHGYDNLFVAGSSVFPSAGYANPTLTIVALALRLAERIAARA